MPNTISVATGDGFKNDLLGRKEFGDRLTNLVLAVGSPSTLLLDGPWGAGKTTFVQMWCDSLKTKGISLIYFNAFDNDYLNDAFTALAGEFVAIETVKAGARKKFVGAAVKIGKSLAIHGGRYAVKAATLGIVDILELSGVTQEIAKDVAKDSSVSAETIIKEKLLARRTERYAMEEFRKELAAFVTSVKTGEADDSTEAPPLIFVIDELDRCKPDFALSLVEGVKHLFAVPGVVFLLVTNLDQMCSAVRATYGSSIDARGYLEKFYHLMIQLPEPVRSGADPVQLRRFVDAIFSGLPSDTKDPRLRSPEHRALMEHLLVLYSTKGLSLRKLERLATQVAVVYASTRDGQLREASLIADLCLMKSDAPNLFSAARRGRLKVPELESFLGYKNRIDADKDEAEPATIWAANLWRYSFGEELLAGQDKEMYGRELAQVGLRDPKRYIRTVCDWIDGFAFPTVSAQ